MEIDICKRCGRTERHAREICVKCVKTLRSRLKFHNKRARGKNIGKVSLQEWIDILCENNFSCANCNTSSSKNKPLELDHIIPLHAGGANFSHNLQPLCRSCHELKDLNLPSNVSLFHNENEVYESMTKIFISWIERKKNWKRQCPIIINFISENNDKFTQPQILKIESRIECFI